MDMHKSLDIEINFYCDVSSVDRAPFLKRKEDVGAIPTRRYMDFVYKDEHGHISPVTFVKLDITCYDSIGKEIIEPICEKCKNSMQSIVGKDSYIYVCMECNL